VQKLRLIYESGTSDISATSHGTTIGYSSGGGLYTGSTTTQTVGESRTRAAQKASPPEKRPYRTAIVIAIIGLLLVHYNRPGWDWEYWYMIFWGGAKRLLYLGLIIIGVAVWLAYKAFKYNSREWPGKYQNWNRSWHCNRCGEIYIH